MHSCQTHRCATAKVKLDAEKMLEKERKEQEQECKQERKECEHEHVQEKREREHDRREREQERKEHDQNENVLLEYKIFDRIAQGMMSCGLYCTLLIV